MTFIEARYVRRPFEKILLVLDGNGVMAEFSDGLENRLEEWDFPNAEIASVNFDAAVVKILMEGFHK